MTHDTPATRQLTAAGISFKAHAYDPGKVLTAMDAVRELAVEPQRMLKSLVARCADGRLVLALVPVPMSLDLPALARAVGAAGCVLAERSAVEEATGSRLGTIGPLGLPSPLPTVVDAGALQCPSVYVSSGVRGVEIELQPTDLVSLCGAAAAPIAYSSGPVASAK